MVEYGDDYFLSGGVEVLARLGGIVVRGNNQTFYQDYFPKMEFLGRNITYCPNDGQKIRFRIGFEEWESLNIARLIVMGIGYNPPNKSSNTPFLFLLKGSGFLILPAITHIKNSLPDRIEMTREKTRELFIPPFRRNRSH